MKITCYGAAGGVTGSKHLIEYGGRRVLLDCGMFQGRRKESQELNAALPMEIVDVDAIVVSHAHLDHCGLLPLLITSGYKGKIFCTSTTCDIIELILSDSAHIQEQDFKYLEKKRIQLAEPSGPLYTSDDIPETLSRLTAVPYHHTAKDWTTIAQGIRLKLFEAGHILGSASPVLEIDGPDGAQRIAFSGDIGRMNTPLLKDPKYPTEEVSTLLLESTYGDRLHPTLKEAVVRLGVIINRTVERNGKIIIPAFALGRTQELVYILHKLTDNKKIPRMPIYVDSPLAVDTTRVFQQHRDDYDTESWEDFGKPDEPPLIFKNLSYTNSVQESMELNTKPGPFAVISAAGMCEAGRIRHHLKNSIKNPDNVILITGFMAENTLGRRLMDGEERVRIFDKWYDVRAAVEVFREFSAHADAEELQAYAENVPGLENIMLVHGEPQQTAGLKERLANTNPKWKITIPEREKPITV